MANREVLLYSHAMIIPTCLPDFSNVLTINSLSLPLAEKGMGFNSGNTQEGRGWVMLGRQGTSQHNFSHSQPYVLGITFYSILLCYHSYLLHTFWQMFFYLLVCHFGISFFLSSPAFCYLLHCTTCSVFQVSMLNDSYTQCNAFKPFSSLPLAFEFL